MTILVNAGWLPKSVGARRRLTLFAVCAVTLIVASALALRGLRDSISYFYTPSQALARARPGEAIELGGLVETGSVRADRDGGLSFRVRDRWAAMDVRYRGAPPDLFREGQGVVASGALAPSGIFLATGLLAKHDERYVPRQLVTALKARGEWRGDAEIPAPLSRQIAASRRP